MVSFELFESNEGPPERATDLLALWRHFNALGDRPTREDFTPHNLQPWLGKIDVFAVEQGGETFRMRLNGTEIVALTGEDWTGRTARDIDRHFNVTLHDEMLRIRKSKQPMTDHIRIFQKDYIGAFRLLLPVFAADGSGEVDQIFLAIFEMG